MVYIIAEIGINHNGSLEHCHALIHAAAQAKCDAVKLQLFRASTLYPRKGGNLNWREGDDASSYDIYSAVESFETPFEWLEPLMRHCADVNIDMLASVFDRQTLHEALRLKMPRLKLASSVITNFPLLKMCAGSGLPCILSTGGSNLSEVEQAVNIILQNSVMLPNKAITLMHCNLQYPTPLENCNLGVLRTLSLAFPNISIGYSDHTSDAQFAPHAATLLGATMLEKHITLNRNMKGPDHFFALEPDELIRMVQTVRLAENEIKNGANIPVDDTLYGSTALHCAKDELYLRNFLYPVLFTNRSIAAGERILANDTLLLRPATKTRGLDASHIPLLNNYFITARQPLDAQTALHWEHIFIPEQTQRIILLRADAHYAVGTGDLASFMALSRWLEKMGAICHFCIRASSEGLLLLHSYGVADERIHALAVDLPIDEEVALTATLARSLKADVTLVQVTDRPLAAYATMQVPGLKACVSFESSTPKGFDIVWSWDITVSGTYDKTSQAQTKWFLGPEFVILPPEFDWNLCKNRKLRQPRRNLLVAMGGGDADDLTGAVAKRLGEINCELKVTFILGSGYAHELNLRHILNSVPYNWEIKTCVTDMFKEYMNCDICIAAGGLTASELAFTRTPAILIAAAGHQNSRCMLFSKKGWANYIGTCENWHLEAKDLNFIPKPKAPFKHRLDEVIKIIMSNKIESLQENI